MAVHVPVGALRVLAARPAAVAEMTDEPEAAPGVAS
jgi:hypothetical protein